jgi:hypothetical protein
MTRLRLLLGLVLLIALMGVSWVRGQSPSQSYDVVVYGGTPAGIMAAIEAHRQGASVALIEPGSRIGGMTASGLGATDVSTTFAKKAVGGLAREFYTRIYSYYQNPNNWTRDHYEDYKDYKYWGYVKAIDPDIMWTFEPHVALQTFVAMLQENNIPLFINQHIEAKGGVEKDGTRITAIRTESGDSFQGKVFIDATYEGDLMAFSGVSYFVGREANSTYGETLNGVHYFTGSPLVVDPYRIAADKISGLLPLISGGPPGNEGTQDDNVMAYCYRLCLTDIPDNKVDFTKPTHYDPALYELLLRYLSTGKAPVFGNNVRLPNGKTDMNNGNPWFSLDLVGGSKSYPDADYATRDKIIERHRDYEQGYLWFLANDPRVPKDTQDEVRKFGLCKDEFKETDHWPPLLYVREARRMIGDYMTTEANARWLNIASDPVAMAGNDMDSHQTSRYLTSAGSVATEGSFLRAVYPFGISYRSLTPKKVECSNLLVPVCLSATHVAYGSIRMEPVFMELGQSAGAAASLAVKMGTSVQEISYSQLRKVLEDGLEVLPTVPETKAIVIDDDQATYSGEWTKLNTGPFVGRGYRISNSLSTTAKVSFPLVVHEDGVFELRFFYKVGKQFAPNAKAVISDGLSETEHLINLTATTSKGACVSLGTYSFEKSKAGSIRFDASQARGPISVDAVMLLPQPP